MTTNSEQLIQAFDTFKRVIDAAYAKAREQLADGDWDGTQRTLAAIAQTHARTSVSLRNLLIKRGMLAGEE